jgi:N-acetylmuramoyl-L-alanine amidase
MRSRIQRIANFSQTVMRNLEFLSPLGFSTSAPRSIAALLSCLAISVLVSACHTPPLSGTLAPRRGDEIVAAGQFVHTGTPVVLWMDPGGYDAYRVERRFSPLDKSDWETSQAEVRELTSPNRYNLRKDGLSASELERVRGGGWDLPTLQRVVDQFVIHFDASGTSRQCFNILHDHRDLSVHFMLDLDGTIYQTLDLKERAWHATSSNTRSVGIEIANIGAYPTNAAQPLGQWYATAPGERARITIPSRFGDGGIRTPGFTGHPARSQPIVGKIQDQDLIQYDFTPQQYRALVQLTAALTKLFPKIACECPRDPQGNVITRKLSDPDLKSFHGVLGHFHIQSEKVDPGPAFNWDYVISGARRVLNRGISEPANQTSMGHMRPRSE